MNYMPEIFKMLDIKIGEKFRAKVVDGTIDYVEDGNLLSFEEYGERRYGIRGAHGHRDDEFLRNILCGDYEIEKQ